MNRISRGAEQLLDLLRWYGQRFKRVFPSQATLARKLDVCARQIRRYLRELEAAGFLSVYRRGPNTAEYHPVAQSLRSLDADNAAKMSALCPSIVRPASGVPATPPYMLSSAVVSRPRVARKPPQRELTGLEICLKRYGL